VSVLAATQKPGGIGTGQIRDAFNSFRDNFGIRLGLRTSSWQVSELGTPASP
jgi:S-DNA-T family DNA segregation ATPase FtsK/SpoIIIE